MQETVFVGRRTVRAALRIALGLSAVATASATDWSRWSVYDLPVTANLGVNPVVQLNNGLIGGTAGGMVGANEAVLPFVGSSAESFTSLSYLGFEQAFGQAINENGDVAGSAAYLNEDGSRRWTLYRFSVAGGVHDLGMFNGGGGAVYDMNERGDVVGFSTIVSGPMFLGRGFFYSDATGTVNLGTLGGYQSYAVDVNNDGLVTGWANTPEQFYRAIAWQSEEQLRDLGTLGGHNSRGFFVNDAGEIFGQAEKANSETVWFVWRDGVGMREFRPRAGTFVSLVFQSSSRGDLTGLYFDESGRGVLFRYSAESGFTDLVNVGPDGLGRLIDVNRRGEAVAMVQGEGWPSNPTFFSPAGGAERLDTIEFGLTWPMQNVVAINDAGQILVTGMDEAGRNRAAVLTPPPACLGDVDRDGVVGLADLARLLGAFGCRGGACVGDLNDDGTADLSDLAMLLSRFGSACQ